MCSRYQKNLVILYRYLADNDCIIITVITITSSNIQNKNLQNLTNPLGSVTVKKISQIC